MAYFDELVSAYNEDTRHMVPFVEIYFDGEGNAPEIYTEDVVVRLDLLEEVQTVAEQPIGALSSNELYIELANDDRQFSPTNPSSPLQGKLLPNVMVKAYLGIFSEHITDTSMMLLEPFTTTWEAYSGMTMADFIDGLGDEKLGYVPLGTFWTNDWEAPFDSVSATVTCYDHLYILGQLPLVPTRVLPNTNMHALFELAFEAAGVSSTNYEIDANLLAIDIKRGWLPKGELRKVLQYLAEASGSWVYVDRNNKIQVKLKTNSVVTETKLLITDNNQIINYIAPVEYLSGYSTISVDIFAPLAEIEQLIRETEIEVPPAGKELENAKFVLGPVEALNTIFLSNPEVVISALDIEAWGMQVTLSSLSGTQETDMVVTGRVLKLHNTVYKLHNATMAAIIGEREAVVSNPLIQNESHASAYTTRLMTLLGTPYQPLVLSIRGNMGLEIADSVRIQHKESSEVATIRMLHTHYDGALSVELEAERTELQEEYVFITPFMITTN